MKPKKTAFGLNKSCNLLISKKSNKIVAFKKENCWKLVQSNLSEIGDLIEKEFLVGSIEKINNLLCPIQSLISDEPEFVKDNECFSKELEGTLLAFGVNNKKLASLQEKILEKVSKIIDKNKIIKEVNPHISVSFLTGANSLVLLQKELDKICKKIPKFSVSKVSLFLGKRTDYDYICLQLQTPEYIKELTNQIYQETNTPPPEFKNGYISHITLFKIEKGFLTEELRSNLSEIIDSIFLSKVRKITPDSAMLFNNRAKVEIRKPLND